MTNNNNLKIERIFNAPVEKVWEAWTNPELIKQWWGPEGFTAPSIKLDLEVGGKYIFAMRGPEGSEWDNTMYSAGEFKEIIPNQTIVLSDYFADEQGNKIAPQASGQDQDFPDEQTVTISFDKLSDGKTKLVIEYPVPDSQEAREAMLKSGMVEGWNSSLDKLEKVLG